MKICGLRTLEAAQTAAEAGAHLLGTILVPGRERTVDPAVAKQISQMCHKIRIERKREFSDSRELFEHLQSDPTEGPAWFEKAAALIVANGPFLVGVFRNQSLEDVQRISEELQLDIVQLHGSEDFDEYISHMDLPVIPRYVLEKPNIGDSLATHKHLVPLLDSEAGGEGKLISWDDANEFGETRQGRYLLAGGLTPDNVATALRNSGCVGVDVSGGVETDKQKDLSKIRDFVAHAKH